MMYPVPVEESIPMKRWSALIVLGAVCLTAFAEDATRRFNGYAYDRDSGR